LQAHDSSPTVAKDVVGTVTGKGFALFARSQPDTPSKLAVHAFSYEHMEEAAYDMLARVAERVGDSETVDVARRIEAQEREMGDRLAALFDRAAYAGLREGKPDRLSQQLDDYLSDAHAIEAQAIELLKRGPDLVGGTELASAFHDHLAESEEHQRLVEARLRARGASSSMLKDAMLRLGALNWGAFFGAQPDTPAKLAAFAYAFEHLEIGAYELLRRVARRAADDDTGTVAERILAEERAAADRIHSLFEDSLEASLQAQGITTAR
jgi:ferritin-like metal-binding protein YciE